MMGPTCPILRMDKDVHQVGGIIEIGRRVAGHGQTGRRNILIAPVEATKVGKLLGQIGDGAKLLPLLLHLLTQQGRSTHQNTKCGADQKRQYKKVWLHGAMIKVHYLGNHHRHQRQIGQENIFEIDQHMRVLFGKKGKPSFVIFIFHWHLPASPREHFSSPPIILRLKTVPPEGQ